jgi:protein gp37
MSGLSKIEWTDRTWNPVTGCSAVSPGCDHCYAETIANRFKGTKAFPNGFELTLRPDRLEDPLHWRKPSRVFVNSMSDLFHPSVPDEFIASVFTTMAKAGEHTFQILTKRPQRMCQFMGRFWLCDCHAGKHTLIDSFYRPERVKPLSNVWLGTSIESDRFAFRAAHLRATPAAVRFLSLEPLLGPLPNLDLKGIDWVIVGAESGRGARPMDLDWVREIRDQCIAADVRFFFKQDADRGHKIPVPELDGRQWMEYPR